MKDAASDGLPEAPWRYEALYPDPLGEQYVEVVQDFGGHSIEHVSHLASGGWAWSGWHIDSNPGGSIVSQLERGRKLFVLHHMHTRGEDPLQKTHRASVGKASFPA